MVLAASLAIAILQTARDSAPSAEPLMTPDRIGHFHYSASTKNKKAQAFFNQGLAMVYGYQYFSARRSFEQAEKLDPDCAIAYWGEALAYGPTINSQAVGDPASKAAIAALDKADKAPHATPLERELIAAEKLRFAVPAPADRKDLNKAYTDAMRKIWQEHPRDVNTGVLFADALIDQHAWDQWTPQGQPKEGTEELMATLNQVIKMDRKNPHALHLYIHVYEASPFAERAKFAADGLENLQPGLSHMQHMPCHIYIHTGDWDKAVKANENCLAVAKPYLTSMGLGDWAGPNLDHYEMALADAASMRGQSALAQNTLDGVFKGHTVDEILARYPDEDGELPMNLENYKRFGKWDEILAAPDYGPKAPISNAMRFADRAVAFAAKGQLDDAKKEKDAFDAALAALPDKDYDGFDTVHQFLAVDQHLVAGEILVREDGHMDEGLAELQKAVEAQDALHYSEPPIWLMPARHSLGAALILAGKYPEAEAVYQEDLRRNPENGWALFGLSMAYKMDGKKAEAGAAQKRFKKAWKDADVAIQSSCLCLPPKN